MQNSLYAERDCTFGRIKLCPKESSKALPCMRRFLIMEGIIIRFWYANWGVLFSRGNIRFIRSFPLVLDCTRCTWIETKVQESRKQKSYKFISELKLMSSPMKINNISYPSLSPSIAM